MTREKPHAQMCPSSRALDIDVSSSRFPSSHLYLKSSLKEEKFKKKKKKE